ncbi:hypothetical protein [Cardinium endosymbiont of Tipula unca]|uniref:Ppx/GppA phosphatase family protein n=1 Tax=Cardinium endosymbiont of Tipula unca TaxID=3066216 RepID=UPI0030D502F7
MSKLAVIDLGTNVIKVLVGSVTTEGYTLLYEEKLPIVMSPKSITTTRISQKEKENIIDILVRIKKKLDVDGVQFIVAKATSLLREASNSVEIIEAIYVATFIHVEVISGTEEAELIYLGISSFLKLTAGNGLIVDIGGGSVECIIFNKDEKLWETSLPLGVRRVASQFMYSDPITLAQVGSLEDHYHAFLEPLAAINKLYKPYTLVGCSGAFRTLLMLYKCHYPLADISIDHDVKTISIKQFFDIYHVILKTPIAAWEGKVAVETVFLRLIPLSAILINLIICKCSIQEIIISDKSLKTGLFIREWHRLKDQKLI